MENKKVLLLELNELSPRLLKKFIDQGELPNFKKMYEGSNCHTTTTDCDVEHLEPWIQWVTLHTGLRFDEHQIFRLGEAQNITHDSIWNAVSKDGRKSWVCGSMNVRVDQGDANTQVLPDPWSIDVEPNPKELSAFYKFVQKNVQEHTNDGHTMGIGDYLKFLKFMLGNGLSFSTISQIVSLIVKQVTKAPDAWKKATLLDALQWDLFKHKYKKDSPDFATFFSNSTAHFQHKFWRYMEPEHFSVDINNEQISAYKDAILYGYKNHDKIVGEAMAMMDSDTTLVLATALSQQPFTAQEEHGGKRFHRPHDLEQFVAQFGLQGVAKVSPVMSHQFHIIFENSEATDKSEEFLRSIKFNGEPLFMVERETEGLFLGCVIQQEVPKGSMIDLGSKQLDFHDVFYLADNLKSGCHHPHGVFWAYRAGREQAISTELLPLEKATGVILEELGLQPQLNQA